MKVGILGGSFNPIHLGHLLIGEFTRIEFSLDKVLFMVGYSPPHKDFERLLPPETRLQFTKLAIEDNIHFELCDIEFRETQSSFTVEVLRSLGTMYPESSEFFLIIGSDSLLDIKTWYKWEELWDLAKIIVIPRSKYPIESSSDEIRSKILISECPKIEFSSTEIRKRLKNRESVRYMVPDNILTLLNQQKEYS